VLTHLFHVLDVLHGVLEQLHPLLRLVDLALQDAPHLRSQPLLQSYWSAVASQWRARRFIKPS
jgi:hypothetical protein